MENRTEVWNALHAALTKFLEMSEDGKSTVAEVAAQRRKVEAFERVLSNLNEKKVA